MIVTLRHKADSRHPRSGRYLEFTGDNLEWKRIHIDNVVPAEKTPEGYMLVREIKNRVLAGETVDVYADYDPNTGVLMVYGYADGPALLSILKVGSPASSRKGEGR